MPISIDAENAAAVLVAVRLWDALLRGIGERQGNAVEEAMRIEGLNHVQLAMPAGKEDAARHFYGEILGIPEVQKPANLAKRGGCWFERGTLKVHLGVDQNFRPAKKAHPAFTVTDLPTLIVRMEAAGFIPVEDEPLEGYNRRYVADPFGNRIELMEPV